MTSRQQSIVCFAALIAMCVGFSSGRAQNFWQQTSGPYGGDVYCLAINSGRHIFTGTNGNGVYRSIDNGDSWTQINSGLTNKTVYVLAINSSNHLFAGTQAGVFRSIDHGDNWEQKGLTSSSVLSFAINSGGHIFAGSDWGVFRSTTNGDSWTIKMGFSTSNAPNAIAINSLWHVFVGFPSSFSEGSVYRSTNNGDTWKGVGLLNKRTRVLAINSLGYVFAGTDGGVYRSTDNAGSWTAVNIGLMNTDVRALAINSSDHIFAGAYGGGVYRSNDNGDSWTPINAGLTNPFVNALAINSSGYLFAGTWGNGVFRSVQPITRVNENESGFPQTNVLDQNYPNPFNPVTVIQYQLPKQTEVRLEIHNILGELVRRLVDERQPAGYYTVRWNGKDERGRPVTSGVYLYRLTAGEFSQVRKMSLLR